MSRLADIFNSILSDRLSPTEQRDIVRGFSVLEDTVRDLGSSVGAGGRGSRISSGSVVLGNGIKLFNPRTGFNTVALSPSGDFSTGYDLDRPEYTSLKVLANDQYYNGETLGIGDVLLGDNTSGAANLFWDRSTGRLNFRGGTTVNTYIDTDGTINATSGVFSGTITATAGVIGGWTIDATRIYNADVFIDSANSRIDVGSAAGIVIDGGNNRIRSSNFASGVSGWQIKSDGSAEFENILARGEIKTSVFTLNEVHVTGGTQAVVRRAGTLYADFTTPNLTETIQIANHGGGSICDFINTDIIRIKTGLAIDSWMSLSNKSQQADYAEFTATHEGGSITDSIKAGAAIIGYSATTGGSIYLSADDGIGKSANLSIIKHSGSPWTDEALMVRLGNLDDSYGATTETYGIGIGDFSGGNYLSYNADGSDSFVLSAAGGGVVIDDSFITVIDPGVGYGGINYQVDDSGTLRLQGLMWGDSDDTSSFLWIQARRDSGAPWDTRATLILSAYDSITPNSARLYIKSDGRAYFENIDYVTLDGGLGVGNNAYTPGAGEIHASGKMVSLVDGSGGGFWAGASNDVQLYRYAANVWYTPDEFRVATKIWALGDGSAGGFKIGTDCDLYRSSADLLYTNDDFSARKLTARGDGSSYGLFLGTDTQIYRVAANELQTPDLFRFGTNIWVTGYGVFSGSTSLYLRNDSARINFGTGDDCDLYRWGANSLRTNDQLTVDGSLLAGYNDATGKGMNVYHGTTQMGTFTAVDTTWTRINNSLAKNIYTPKYFRAEGGLVAGNAVGASADVTYRGNLRAYDGSTYRDVYALDGLEASEIASATFYGTGKGDTTGSYKTVSTEFSGVPSTAKALLLMATIKYTGSGAWIAIGTTSTYLNALACYTQGTGYISNSAVVPVRADGRIWIRTSNTGMEIWLRCAGYFI